MTLRETVRLPLSISNIGRWTIGLILFVAVAAMIFPNDHADYQPRNGAAHPLVVGTEGYGRFLNTALQVGLPIVFRDWVGLKQLAVVAVVSITATHGLKRGLNNVTVFGSRLGRRPHSELSKYNTPSGHSSLSASGAWFVARRYGLHYLWMLAPMTLLTMYARVMLNAHTISATIAGALLGLLLTALFTTRRTTI